MFNFKEELAKYRASLEVEDLSKGLSGDEVRDIMDIAQALIHQGRKNQKPAAPKGEKSFTQEKL